MCLPSLAKLNVCIEVNHHCINYAQLKQAKEDFLPPFDALPAQRVVAKILVTFIDTAHVLCVVVNDHDWL